MQKRRRFDRPRRPWPGGACKAQAGVLRHVELHAQLRRLLAVVGVGRNGDAFAPGMLVHRATGSVRLVPVRVSSRLLPRCMSEGQDRGERRGGGIGHRRGGGGGGPDGSADRTQGQGKQHGHSAERLDALLVVKDDGGRASRPWGGQRQSDDNGPYSIGKRKNIWPRHGPAWWQVWRPLSRLSRDVRLWHGAVSVPPCNETVASLQVETGHAHRECRFVACPMQRNGANAVGPRGYIRFSSVRLLGRS